MQIVYNDHYIAKNSILNLEKIRWPHIEEINEINITLHESQCVNDRLDYFDKVGIIMDMYQSHVLVILSTLLAHITTTDRKSVLETLTHISPCSINTSCYPEYKGSMPTQCNLSIFYNGIKINVSCGKMLNDEKSLCISTKYSDICIDLSNDKSNPYAQIFEWLNNSQYSHFLSSEEVELLWKHISNFD